ncbi:kappaPI-actitoxin-Avd3d-like, partial [Cetorhinus maximus]
CRAMIVRYFYNKNVHRCQSFVYGGCGSNENNFATMKQSIKCDHFIYGGCGGNQNNFYTVAECTAFCRGDNCISD